MVCRLCNSPEIKKKYHISRFNPGFIIYECLNCGFQFQDINVNLAYNFYNEDYYSGSAYYSYLDERKNEPASRIVWKKRMKKLIKLDFSGGENRNFLDIGCSFGGFMQVAGEFGYRPYGVEISGYSGEYAEKRFGKGSLFLGSIEKAVLPKDFFSIITMVEVIEHVYNPAAAFKNIYDSMKKGGVLLVQTADMAGLQALAGKEKYHYYLPGHISYFSKKNLARLLMETGFAKTRFFGGVEFGLLPKLFKSRSSFNKWSDYFNWFRIGYYHYLSKCSFFGLHMTSSMVMMAWK